MTTASIELRALLADLSDRRRGRSEANVQSLLHAFLIAAPLDLDPDDLIELEAPTAQGGRIDVTTGFTIFEVKRDLRMGKVRADAVEQLAGYVRDRPESTGQRYVGVRRAADPRRRPAWLSQATSNVLAL